MMAASMVSSQSDCQTLFKRPDILKMLAQIKVHFPTTSMRLLTPAVGQASHSPMPEGVRVITPDDGYYIIQGTKSLGYSDIQDMINLEGETGYYSDKIYKLRPNLKMSSPNGLVMCKEEGIVSMAFPPNINAGGSNYHKFGNFVISEPNIISTKHGIGWDEPSYNIIGHGIRPLPHRHYIIDIPEEAGGNMQNYYPDYYDEIKQQQQQNYNWGLMGPVAQQAIAGVLANRIAAAASGTSSLQGVHFMEIAVVFGLSFKLAALVLRRPNQLRLSVWMAKIGDMVTGFAIILSLAMHLPPLLAWIAAPLATLIISLALVFA